jgi:hypothetical protein
MHRYGVASQYQNGGLGLAGLPFIRLPVPPNPAPEPVTYEAMRGLLDDFSKGLASAQASLAQIKDGNVDLPVDLGSIQLNFDASAQGGGGQTLLSVFQAVAGPMQDAPSGGAVLMTDFDASDAAWLEAYSHLLMGLAEFILAHDWRDAFETTFHGVFPDRLQPETQLRTQRKERPGVSLLDALEMPELPECVEDCEAEMEAFMQEMEAAYTIPLYRSIADMVAFVHLNNWPVVEPDRLAGTHMHLSEMVRLSRLSWARILAETDDGNEWIPGPHQTGVLAGMIVDQDRVDGWLALLDELDAILQGEKLIPHWRFEQGVNFKRFLLEHERLDAVLLVQGYDALPFLEDGPKTDAETWWAIVEVFGADFMRYAVWLN